MAPVSKFALVLILCNFLNLIWAVPSLFSLRNHMWTKRTSIAVKMKNGNNYNRSTLSRLDKQFYTFNRRSLSKNDMKNLGSIPLNEHQNWKNIKLCTTYSRISDQYWIGLRFGLVFSSERNFKLGWVMWQDPLFKLPLILGPPLLHALVAFQRGLPLLLLVLQESHGGQLLQTTHNRPHTSG